MTKKEKEIIASAYSHAVKDWYTAYLMKDEEARHELNAVMDAVGELVIELDIFSAEELTKIHTDGRKRGAELAEIVKKGA